VHLVRKAGMLRKDDKLPRYMALKMLSREYIQSHGWEEMVENERHAMAELCTESACPFLVKLYSCFVTDRHIFFLMELLDGGDLYAVMRKQLDEPRMPEKHAMFFVAAVTDAIQAVHKQGIIYRDLKPENIFLCEKGYPRVADFGLCKKVNRSYTVCGTPDYMAPELILAKGHSYAVDWWAVGVLIFEITTGRTPFTGREPMDIYESVLAHEDGCVKFPDSPALSKGCKQIIEKLLSVKPNKRQALARAGFSTLAWFDGFQWDKLRAFALPPPIPIKKRKVEHFEQPDYVNKYDAKLMDAPVDKSGWKPNFG
jgi:serine/threonine protein kinase